MRILVATDGSTDAVEAMEWLGHLPLPADAAVEAVGAVPYPLIGEGYAAVAWRRLEEQTQGVVDDARRRLAKRWPNATGRVLGGDPREVVVEAATKSRADLIVLGARGLGAIGSALLGSVSIGVVRHAPCPVLVCKGAARPLRAVTIGVDGSDDARAALTYFARLPLPPGLSVRLVGVVEPLRSPAAAPELGMATALVTAMQEHEDERRRELLNVLGPAATELRPHAARTTTVTPVGSPIHCILREADQENSDLIVVGARGLGTFKRILLGSVSEAVLRGASCPVLIVRRGAGARVDG